MAVAHFSPLGTGGVLWVLASEQGALMSWTACSDPVNLPVLKTPEGIRCWMKHKLPVVSGMKMTGFNVGSMWGQECSKLNKGWLTKGIKS